MIDQPTQSGQGGGARAAARRRGRATGGPAAGRALSRAARDFAALLEFGDALVLLYLAAFAREYFWGVGVAGLAWALTACAAGAAWYFYVSTRPAAEPATRAFWLIVGLPLAFLYLLRAPVPDISFDVLNCRLLQSERALRGPLFLPGDFFPSPLPGNPAPDIVTGISRHLLGYRLGTVVNLLALVWAGVIVERLLRPLVRGDRRRAACVLLVLMSEYVLFEINEYMVDLLALPLVLEAVRIVLDAGDGPRDAGGEAAGDRADAVRAAFLLGAAAALKLTYASAALALAPFYARRFLVNNRRGARPAIKTLAGALAVSVAPALPFCIYIYSKTGNPFFPLYNGLFRSPYWTLQNYHDPRWGPVALWEKLAWPLLVTFSPERTTELKIYSGRVTLGCLAALALLLTARRDGAAKRTRDLSLILLLDALLWSATTGYIRYALQLELLGGVLVVALAARLGGGASGPPPGARRAASRAVLCVLVAQASLALAYTLNYEWSMRPTLLRSPPTFFREARLVGRDRSLADFLPADERSRVGEAGAWVWSGIKTPGVEALLRPDLRVVAVRQGEYFATAQSRAAFADAVARASGGRVMSLSLTDDLDESRKALGEHGLRIVSTTPFSVPYFSTSRRIPMCLLEVEPASP